VELLGGRVSALVLSCWLQESGETLGEIDEIGWELAELQLLQERNCGGKAEKGVLVGLMQEVVMSWGHKNTRRCFGCEISDLERK